MRTWGETSQVTVATHPTDEAKSFDSGKWLFCENFRTCSTVGAAGGPGAPLGVGAGLAAALRLEAEPRVVRRRAPPPAAARRLQNLPRAVPGSVMIPVKPVAVSCIQDASALRFLSRQRKRS